MNDSELEKLFAKYRDIIAKEKEYKYAKISLEELNTMQDELFKLREENENLKLQNEELEAKYNNSKSKASSWSSKYHALERKEKNSIYNELKEQQFEILKRQARDIVEWNADSERNKLELEYEKKKAELDITISRKVNERIDNLAKIRDEFSSFLSEEKDRYEEKYDLENERNQGYLIGIAKTRKVMLEAFDRYIKQDLKNITICNYRTINFGK